MHLLLPSLCHVLLQDIFLAAVKTTCNPENRQSRHVHVTKNYTCLRTVPPFSTAHTFCASRDGLKNSGPYGRYLLIQRNFCTVCVSVGKADLINACWNLKRTLGVTTHFLSLNLERKCPTLLCILQLF